MGGRRKRAGIIPGYRESDGYWRGARSSCCGAPLVYLVAGQYVRWHGFENQDPAPDRLRCEKCNGLVAAKET